MMSLKLRICGTRCKKFSTSLAYFLIARARQLGHTATARQQVGFPSAVRCGCKLFLASGFPCVALLAHRPGHEEVTPSLLFCRCLETEFECVASSGICTVRGRLVRQFHNFSNSNPGLGMQVTCT